MSEINLVVSSLHNDSVSFQVSNVSTKEPLIANIELYVDKPENGTILQTDSLGFGTLVMKKNYQKIQVTSIGYRSLIIDISNLNRL